ncbi:MAG: 4Fe-4S dicluster domain-containing protein [Desulfarculus sp.]|nr:MAG: 4Fe-4S dicluster domain-containing protein [Desulfarculus sp.]
MRSTPADSRQYRAQLRRALDNQFLRQTLAGFAARNRQQRAETFAGLDFAALAQEVARIKDDSLSRLPELYQQFKQAAEAGGAQVHLAADAAEANRIIADIAKKAGCQRLVKSKSMTSEEIFLNDYLEAQGLTVTETDLGEWIIQLRGEGPSHMIAPAIHLSRQEVAQLFSRVTGRELDPQNVEGLVEVARQELRQAFLSADMGISGGNFCLADSGAIGIVTNEGNARLVTTLPRVHVALVGLEKLVPDLGSALTILSLLVRNTGMGQPISGYVTWISGAVPCATGADGRKEMHVVFLDNGRLALSQDPVFKEALRCIRCGSCANVCPIYAKVGGHNYGHVYIGAIGLILTYFYHGRENARALVKNCLNCQACKAACPAGIDLPRLIKKTAGLVLAQEPRRPAKNRLLAAVLKNRRLFHFLLRRAYLTQKPLARGERLIRHLPFFFGREQGFRSLPVVARRPLRDRWPELARPEAKPHLRVALFGGCLVDFVYPEQAEALLRLLRGRGVRLDYPLEQTCCGLPALMMSEEETAREVAVQNLRALDPAEHDYVLTLCASCGSHLKENLPRLLEGAAGLAVQARQLAGKVIDFSSFMVDVLGVEPALGGSGAQAAYHAPCHLCRGLGVQRAPRELLRAAGYQYLPYAEEEVCCGFGGSYSLEFPELSAAILESKLDQVAATGAELLVTDCPGCVLQLRGGLDQRRSPIQVLHMAEAAAAALDKPRA